jgi:hypothetical protein
MRKAIDSERTVTINREKLVAKLKENRALHAKIYVEAGAGYLEACVEHMKKVRRNYARALKQIEEQVPLPAEGVRWSELDAEDETPQAPTHSLNAYDEAIELFSWHEAEQVKLTVEEFRHYVLDKWGWKRSWLETSSTYSESAASMVRK